jgi:hypothetical protein
LCELVVLLPSIGTEVVEIFLSISVAIVSTEFQVVGQVFKCLDGSRVYTMLGLAHDVSFLNYN